MNCRKAEKMIAELSRAELGSPPKPLARHIADCGKCRRRLEEQACLLDGLSLVPERELSEDEWREISRGINFGALAAGLAGARVTRAEPAAPSGLAAVIAPITRRRLAAALLCSALAVGIGMLLGAWLFPRTRIVNVAQKAPEAPERVVEVPVEAPVTAPVSAPSERPVPGARRASPVASPRATVVAAVAPATTSSYHVEVVPVREEVRTWLAGETSPSPPSLYELPPPPNEWEENTFLPGEWDRPPETWGFASFIVP